MFKIIHTSDWHLGKTFHQYNRDDEFEFFFQNLYHRVKTDKPDALLISGDIFDTMSPSLSAQRLWASVLENLTAIAPHMDIIAIAGNHDSGSKLDVYANLFRDKIHIVGRSQEFFVLTGADGSHAVVCAVPYIPGGFYRNYLEAIGYTGDDEESHMKQYFRAIAEKGAELRPTPDTPLILMAHTAVTGADFTGQEEYKFVFNDVSLLGEGYDYIALGHIHYPQNVKEGAAIVRYSGAPFAMGFDEAYPHSLSVVCFDGRKPALEIFEHHELRTPISLFEDAPLKSDDVKDFIKKYEKETADQYLRIFYHDDGTFNLAHRRQLEVAFAEHPHVRLCVLQPVKPAAEHTEDGYEAAEIDITPENVASLDAMGIAERRFYQIYNTEMPEKLVSLLKSVIYEDSEN